MAQSPNPIVERFPFLTTIRGLGTHQAMMDQFIHLAIKGVLFSSHAGSMKVARKTSCHKDHLSCLDVLHDVQRSWSKLPGAGGANDQFVPTPFCPLESPGEHDGVLLKPSLVPTAFLRVSPCLWIIACCCNASSNLAHEPLISE
jgi:hypothetical protein